VHGVGMRPYYEKGKGLVKPLENGYNEKCDSKSCSDLLPVMLINEISRDQEWEKKYGRYLSGG
jgi:hypothetical protein